MWINVKFIFQFQRLQNHKISKHSGNNQPPTCTVCNKQFEYPSQLQRHMSSHSPWAAGERVNFPSFQCSQCNASFKSGANLEAHMWKHGGRKVRFMMYFYIASSNIQNSLVCEKYINACRYHGSHLT